MVPSQICSTSHSHEVHLTSLKMANRRIANEEERFSLNARVFFSWEVLHYSQ